MTLYMCAEAYRCTVNKNCGHYIPHEHDQYCKAKCNPEGGEAFTIDCVPIPDETFFNKGDFEI